MQLQRVRHDLVTKQHQQMWISTWKCSNKSTSIWAGRKPPRCLWGWGEQDEEWRLLGRHTKGVPKECFILLPPPIKDLTQTWQNIQFDEARWYQNGWIWHFSLKIWGLKSNHWTSIEVRRKQTPILVRLASPNWMFCHACVKPFMGGVSREKSQRLIKMLAAATSRWKDAEQFYFFSICVSCILYSSFVKPTL